MEPPSKHYEGRFTMGATMHAMDRLVHRARAAGTEVVDVEEGSYADGDEVDGVYTFTVVDPEGSPLALRRDRRPQRLTVT